MRMPNTMFEKLVARSAGRDVATGEVVELAVDRMMIHDVFALNCFRKFSDMGFARVADPNKVIVVYDHLVPTGDARDLPTHKKIDEFLRQYGIAHMHRADGICHQIMVENGYVRPGHVVLGTDSHTVTYGALGSLALGIGYTEMAAALGTGSIWIKVAPSLCIDIEGEKPPWLFGKDLALRVLKTIGSNGANYRVMEFGGSAVSALSMDSRFTLCNMATEAGAKAGLMACDNAVEAYLCERGHVPDDIMRFNSDAGARYESRYTIDVANMEPQVCFPYDVENVGDVTDFKNVAITQAFLGSCTNGRLEDLAAASRILKGKKVAKNVRLIVVPATRSIFSQAAKLGYIRDLVEAGAIVQHPSCSLCAGLAGGLIDDSDTLISSTNRNFPGRMGEKGAQSYLASAATVAASALEGVIADCRHHL
jgi:3-isopropylmalate/(R)-2-methylmalate dehydratase large subunit